MKKKFVQLIFAVQNMNALYNHFAQIKNLPHPTTTSADDPQVFSNVTIYTFQHFLYMQDFMVFGISDNPGIDCSFFTDVYINMCCHSVSSTQSSGIKI